MDTALCRSPFRSLSLVVVLFSFACSLAKCKRSYIVRTSASAHTATASVALRLIVNLYSIACYFYMIAIHARACTSSSRVRINNNHYGIANFVCYGVMILVSTMYKFCVAGGCDVRDG